MEKTIQRIFPLGFPWETRDPFLFCVHHLDHYPEGNDEMGPAVSLEGRNLGNDFQLKDGWRMYHGHTIPGFPYHPHRGFETITIVNKGYCDHSDSLGAAGRFGQGDVQWMTAGRGVQHSEMFPLLNREKDNTLELFQIWLNLPASAKFADPHFKMLWSEDIPLIEKEGYTLQLIAGKYENSSPPIPPPDSWANDPGHGVEIWNINLRPGASIDLGAAANVNRNLYFYNGGSVQIGEQEISSGHGIEIIDGADVSIANGSEPSQILMLQGQPIDEPVAKYGPFVMNTAMEIQQAMDDYRLTQYGGWPWPQPDPVHPKEKGRFAKYPNGTLEEK